MLGGVNLLEIIPFDGLKEKRSFPYNGVCVSAGVRACVFACSQQQYMSHGITYICSGPGGCVSGSGCSMASRVPRVAVEEVEEEGGSSSAPSDDGCSSAP